MNNNDLKLYINDYLLSKVFKLLPLAEKDFPEYLKHKKFLLVQLEGAVNYNSSITRLTVVRNNIKGLGTTSDLKMIKKVVLDSCQDLKVILDEL